MPRLLLILLFILLLHLGRGAAPAAPGPGNSTEAPRATAGNGTRPSPSPETRRPPGPGLLSGPGLPVLRRAVYVLSALSALAALYFVLRAVEEAPEEVRAALQPRREHRAGLPGQRRGHRVRDAQPQAMTQDQRHQLPGLMEGPSPVASPVLKFYICLQ
ncbi:protein FAM174C isoform X1 [Pithys albifrons albifrons]|uniref:protein FAM174C isoform X1 n=1 Tax=Pithys albifrons albifrons TaxID=3385563 RepID=UPI003A5CF477